ncbi:unnamed protein product [Coregonus sp. 'balchen']|nr:unnamed protein product [Coregonus sp. 'balchen']
MDQLLRLAPAQLLVTIYTGDHIAPITMGTGDVERSSSVISMHFHSCDLHIKEKKEEPTSPPPPLSALPGGFLKQLVRETEKETKQKEPEAKEEKAPSKLSDNLVQQFLLPDQTPPILEAEMALRNEQLVNGERGRHSNQSDLKTSTPRRILSPKLKSPPLGETAKKEVTPEPLKQKQEITSEQLKQKQEITTEQLKQKQEIKSELLKQGQEVKSGKEKVTNDTKKPTNDVKMPKMEGKKDQQKEQEKKKEGVIEERQEPEGQQADIAITEHERKELNPSELDLCEDLSELQSVNECGALHTLTSRAKASLPLTHAGPNLLNFWPPLNQQGKTPRSRRGDSVWDAPPALAALVRHVYVSMVGTRRDQSVCAVGRSGTGKTTSCQAFTHTLLKQAGTAGDSISVERIQAVFTILRSFGCVSSQHSDASSRFAMVLSLDFNHAGLASAGHLQTMMLEKWRVCQKMEGESNFLVFSQMLAGLSTEMRTELQMHQFSEANSFGIVAPTKVEEKQRASVAFTKLLVAMETLGFSADEQRAIWHVLAGLYHLGTAGAIKVGRRAFVSFDSAQVASSVLGCEGEELHTAVFKHHLRQLLQRATGGGRERHATINAEEALSSQQLTLASVMVVDTPGLRNPRHRAEGDPRGLLWVLDEEMVTPGSTENTVLERVCQYYSSTVRQCEQPMQCEVSHLMGSDPVRYDLTGWFSLVQSNPSALNAISLLQNSSVGVVKTLFGPRASVPPLCRGLGGVEGGSQRSLQRSGTVRKTFSGGMAAIRRHSHCISVKLQADALLNLIRRARPVFMQCVCAKTDSGSGGFDIPALRVQLHSTHILPALQLYRTGYPEHMTLSDFRCRFQALSPLVMKRYGSVFITPDERKAVEELLVELDLDKKSIVLGAGRVFMKRGVLKYLEQQRDKLVSDWLVQLQAACMGHLARQQYRKMKVQQMAVRCFQSNIRTLRRVAKWSWWKLLCRVRPLLDVNMDDQRLRAKEDEIMAVRRRLEKSERDRNELRQTTDILETKVTAVLSELSDERFRGEAVSQALDMERGERLRLTRENKEIQAQMDQCKVTMEMLEKQLEEEKQKVQSRESRTETGTSWGTTIESEMALQLECCQTEVEYVRRRHKQTEERLEAERQTRLELDTKVGSLQAQLEQSKRSATELKRQVRRDKAIQESTALGAQIYTLRRTLQMEIERMKQIHLKELEDKEEELEDVHKSSQRRLLLSTIDNPGHSQAPDSKEHIERLHCQVDEQVAQLQHENSDLLKRLEEDQEDLNELMKKHKALIAQSSSDISQIRELQAELEEVNKQRHTLQEELATSVARVQFLESSTVGRSIVSKQEAKVCDLENKLEFQRGQVKRFEVLVLRLRDSVVRLGEELEQSAETEARERENMTELSAVRQTLQADLETSIRRIVDLQAALEEVESSDESDDDESDSVSSVGSQSLGTEDVGEGIRHWLGVPRGEARGGSPCGSSTISNQSGRQSVTDTMSTYSFRSCVDPDEEGSEPGGWVGNGDSSGPGRASSSALSELLEGLRKRRGRAETGEGGGSTISLPIYQTTGDSTLRRRASALSLGPKDLQEPRSILKPPSPLLPRAASLRIISEPQASSAASRDSGAKRYSSADSLSSLPSLPLTSPTASCCRPPTISIPEEDCEEPIRSLRSPQPMRRRLLERVVSEGGGEGCLGSEPMVFQNRRLLGDSNRDDAASDILPAIRRAQSNSSLANSVRGGRRALSVHFGELPPSTRSRKGSDSSSTSSGSGGSSQGGGVRCRGGAGLQGERLEAEGSEGGDVASVMKKYLRKSQDMRKSEPACVCEEG